MREMHPLQDESTCQGIMEIMYNTGKYMCEISGMDRFSFQPSGGSQGILGMASLVYAYYKSRGEEKQRNEIITTIYSHPSDAAAPHVKGFKIIYLHPDENGYPDYEAFKAAVNEHTAAFFVANPEDTGVYNKNVLKFTKLVHEKGGLCAYDQANANGLLGVTRARDAGFDMCFFNLHKTFSTPHGGGGPGSGPVGCKAFLEQFLPAPRVCRKEDGTLGFTDPEHTMGRVRSFYGNFLVVVRALTYILTLGREGIPEASAMAVLNANYLMKKLSGHYDMAYDELCMHEFVMTLEKLKNETGVSAMDVAKSLLDYGIHPPTMYFPLIVHEALMVEPTETESPETLDSAADALLAILDKAKTDPDYLHGAPHRCPIGRPDEVRAARTPVLRYNFDAEN